VVFLLKFTGLVRIKIENAVSQAADQKVVLNLRDGTVEHVCRCMTAFQLNQQLIGSECQEHVASFEPFRGKSGFNADVDIRGRRREKPSKRTENLHFWASSVRCRPRLFLGCKCGDQANDTITKVAVCLTEALPQVALLVICSVFGTHERHVFSNLIKEKAGEG